MTAQEKALSDAIILICDLHKQRGGPPLRDIVWECKVDAHWTVWINGCLTAQRAGNMEELRRGDAYVEFNGWPAGSFSMLPNQNSDVVFAAGAIANLKTFRLALQAALDRERGATA